MALYLFHAPTGGGSAGGWGEGFPGGSSTKNSAAEDLLKAPNSEKCKWVKNRSKLHAQYDWTTEVPDNGNDWRKFRAVPRSHPLRPLVVYFV